MLAHPHNRHWGDIGVALLLAVVLSCAWVLRDWTSLSALRLPDTDDVVRLQQIRDWLGGQGFGDLAQHRLGMAPGLEMHWSRLPDLVPGGLIILLSPVVGPHDAAVAAVILWPAFLFAAALVLVARIARALGTSGVLATLVAALAYPATTLFLPGRIDHHGLQLVLLLVVVLTCVSRGSLAGGVAAGIASAASLVVGIETAPLLAVAAAAMAVRWIAGRGDMQAWLGGYGAALVLGLAAASILLRTSGWNWPGCDGFTATFWRAAQFAAFAPLVLALTSSAVRSQKGRFIAALIVGAVALAGALILSPDCLRPYGRVDPLLAKLWLANVAEAQPLLRAPLGHGIGYAGLMLAGSVASILAWWRVRDDRWMVLVALQWTALALTLVQLRGAYAGALLAAPGLAAMIAMARARGVVALVRAWVVSAGMLYPLAGEALAPRRAGTAVVADCTGPAALARLAALPPGILMAPIDLGAFALAATSHRVIAAPYHRGGEGNAAMYRFFLDGSGAAQRIAQQLRVDYVAFCPGDFDELGDRARDPASLNDALRRGTAPGWLRQISPRGELPILFQVTSSIVEPRR